MSGARAKPLVVERVLPNALLLMAPLEHNISIFFGEADPPSTSASNTPPQVENVVLGSV
jgi:hypothetical protein